MRRAPLLAVAVSALIGVVAGVIGGVVLDRGQNAFADPLGVGVPLVDQSCTGKSLLVVGWGRSQSAVAAAVARARGSGDPRYLDTRDSCRTAWKRPGHTPSHYVVYLGPSTLQQACQQRMATGQRGLLVTRLHNGNTAPVQCLCTLAPGSMPVIRTVPDSPSTEETIYIRGLQDLLAHIGRNPADHVTGVYDDQTVAAVTRFQQDGGIPANGVVNFDTWVRLLTLACRKYDF